MALVASKRGKDTFYVWLDRNDLEVLVTELERVDTGDARRICDELKRVGEL